MPRGVHFSYVPKEISSHPREPQFHSFIITKENGAKVYGFSLIFYEQVQDESIINAITSLEKMHSAQVPEIPTNSTLLVREEPVSNSKSLPRHFKVTAPQLIEKKLDCSPKYDPSSDILLVSKSIILTGQYPFVEAARNFLSNFFKFAVHSSQLSSPQSHSLSSLSLESFVYYILFSIPLPSPNQCIVIPNVPSLGWRHSSNVLILQRPSSYVELPLCEYEIGKVVDLLGIDCLIQLWTCLLLESQVLIYSAGNNFRKFLTVVKAITDISTDYSRLMLVAESLTTLLFPFTWPHVYVPILPPAMYNFLDAPVPYLMGLSSLPANDSRLPSEVKSSKLFFARLVLIIALLCCLLSGQLVHGGY
jgi:DENN domain-containing protein 5